MVGKAANQQKMKDKGRVTVFSWRSGRPKGSELELAVELGGLTGGEVVQERDGNSPEDGGIKGVDNLGGNRSCGFTSNWGEGKKAR